ncbi:hypothetical protein [Hyphomicrobium sulfonivorans]|uniref:hypothetical protein n=1 Tax=Hyphomicrobium sulfonivorans TaxID=121290 RepID=UPI0015709B14|nr:hypothetical protein [Hyphomicrobium sulfonivorans]MBI1650838.1 hypothetical protein [Hyphomicrobium sulfonivorans]
MKTFMTGLIALIVGYLVGAVGGYFLVLATTSNAHDAQVEAATSAAFIIGPAAAVFALISALPLLRRRR